MNVLEAIEFLMDQGYSEDEAAFLVYMETAENPDPEERFNVRSRWSW